MITRYSKTVFTLLLAALFIGALGFNVSWAGINDSLVAYYPFNGNANDESGHRYHGLNNGATATSDRFGNVNKALNFNGRDSYVALGSLFPILTGQGEGSISMWFKWSSYAAPAPFGSLVFFGEYGLALGESYSGIAKESLWFQPNPDVAGAYLEGNGYYLDNKWHHVVFEMGSNFNAVYVDGTRLQLAYCTGSETTGNSMWHALTEFFIGASPKYVSTNYFFNGSIDDVRIYNRALSDGEIQELYHEITNVPPIANAGPDKVYELTEPTGAIVALDASASTDADSTPGTNDDIVSFKWYEDGTFLGSGKIISTILPLGNHNVKLVITDKKGNTSEDEVLISVTDTTAPTVSISVSPSILWPPNNKFQNVVVSGNANDLSGNVTLSFKIEDEYHLVEPLLTAFNQTIKLEASRKGDDKDGRVYRIIVTATDASGNVKSAEARVLVPHDQGK